MTGDHRDKPGDDDHGLSHCTVRHRMLQQLANPPLHFPLIEAASRLMRLRLGSPPCQYS
jgi:hypothetical protein